MKGKYHYNYEGTGFSSPIELSPAEQGVFVRVFIKAREDPHGIVPAEDIKALRPILARFEKVTGRKAALRL